MIATAHLLTGAMIGALVSDPTAAISAAFFSHYLLDLLPHIDPETFSDDRSFNWQQLSLLLLDTCCTLSLGLVFFLYHQQWLLILLSGLAAQLPDLLSPLENYRLFTPLRRFHQMWHWRKERARQWSWYIAGFCTQVAVSVTALLVAW